MTERQYRTYLLTIAREWRAGLMTDAEYCDRILMVNADFFRKEG